MSARDPIVSTTEAVAGPQPLEADDGAALMRAFVNAPASRRTAETAPAGVTVGELLALTDDGRTALVRFPAGSDQSAVPARSIVDLHGAHIGKAVVLMFENADPSCPIVMGVVRGEAPWPLEDRPGQVEVLADGERLVVSAKEQLVLRCGKASITLTKAGKVLIDGAYVSSRSSGVNRLKGGSVQLN